MNASPAEIKRAYRRLAKEYHPDRNSASDAGDRIVAINAAYEVLSDRGQRQRYDRDYAAAPPKSPAWRSTPRRHDTGTRTVGRSDRGSASDERVQQWLQQVYRPIDRQIAGVLHSLDNQIEELSADPFDDALMAVFCDYINGSKAVLDEAQGAFRSQPNPSALASVAATVYCCLDRVSDGLEELEYFTLNYDDRHLHMGQELFRIAIGLRASAFAGLRNFS